MKFPPQSAHHLPRLKAIADTCYEALRPPAPPQVTRCPAWRTAARSCPRRSAWHRPQSCPRHSGGTGARPWDGAAAAALPPQKGAHQVLKEKGREPGGAGRGEAARPALPYITDPAEKQERLRKPATPAAVTGLDASHSPGCGASWWRPGRRWLLRCVRASVRTRVREARGGAGRRAEPCAGWGRWGRSGRQTTPAAPHDCAAARARRHFRGRGRARRAAGAEAGVTWVAASRAARPRCVWGSCPVCRRH